jgi:hypothetical protein
MESARQGDSFHIYSCALEDNTDNGLRLQLDNRISTDANGTALCLGLQADAKVDLDKIIEYTEKHVSEKTLLNFFDMRINCIKIKGWRL